MSMLEEIESKEKGSKLRLYLSGFGGHIDKWVILERHSKWKIWCIQAVLWYRQSHGCKSSRCSEPKMKPWYVPLSNMYCSCCRLPTIKGSLNWKQHPKILNTCSAMDTITLWHWRQWASGQNRKNLGWAEREKRSRLRDKTVLKALYRPTQPSDICHETRPDGHFPTQGKAPAKLEASRRAARVCFGSRTDCGAQHCRTVGPS